MLIQTCLCSSCRNLALELEAKQEEADEKKEQKKKGITKRATKTEDKNTVVRDKQETCRAVTKGFLPVSLRSKNRPSDKIPTEECPSQSLINIYNPYPTVVKFSQFSDLLEKSAEGSDTRFRFTYFDRLKDFLCDDSYKFTAGPLSLILLATHNGSRSKKNTKVSGDLKTGKFLLVPTRYLNTYLFFKQYVDLI